MGSSGLDFAYFGGFNTISAPLAPHNIAPSSEIARRASTTTKHDQPTELKVFAVLLRPATCEERVIAAVNCFVVLRRDRFVRGVGMSEKGDRL